MSGALYPGNIFDAYCWHGNASGQQWIYGKNTSGGAGWIIASNIVMVSGRLKGCNS
ncbi:hypothetical protein [Actinacidiphila bryophytorum]|uniref:Uncharacterized protein n=1 Tax=Actinacidiphila bryophytorum TaxID=1436133 RepID=A0A9W4H6M8_9ACTN|nr:hypothetical protein [Actinacidiphila bryophytorum]MBM9436822.1 hypothetical protein [Actinacidiphila bryophytorum]MBN6542335.1 hypothetical protein [Actinacidiphila bryophytorum]CAG7654456.1 hypothetical protein SBRY_60481 [Actinacidiphila bryophytorum]